MHSNVPENTHGTFDFRSVTTGNALTYTEVHQRRTNLTRHPEWPFEMPEIRPCKLRAMMGVALTYETC
jgi:hypothetical protein